MVLTEQMEQMVQMHQIPSATIPGDNLILTMSDTPTINAGNARGPKVHKVHKVQQVMTERQLTIIRVGTVTTGNAGTNALVTTRIQVARQYLILVFQEEQMVLMVPMEQTELQLTDHCRR